MSTFDDLDAFVSARRQAGLALSPDGARLVTTVAELSPDATSYVSAVWEVDPTGEAPARRLTRSAAGESSAAFTPDGDLLFTSRRPDPGAKEPDGEPAALWVLPLRGGEARPVLTCGDGVASFDVARDSGRVVVVTSVPVGPTPEKPADVPDGEETPADAAGALRAARKKAGVTALLHERFPVRFWDHDLGPGRPQLRVHDPLDGERLDPATTVIDPTEARQRLREYAVSPDGAAVAVAVDVRDPSDPAAVRVRVELRRGDDVEVVADEPAIDGSEGADHERPTITPDGRWLLWIRERHARPGRAPAHTLLARPLDGGGTVTVLDEGRLTVQSVVGSAEPDVVLVTADEQGHCPVFRLSITDGGLTRLTGSGAYTDVVASPEGGAVYAMRSAIDTAPTPVRLDPRTPDQDPAVLRGATEIDPIPGTLTEVTATGEDGAPLRAWLALPEGAGPHPLLLWIHGGPFGSWNAWTWRWNPWTATARGYAVLLPDPRLSTGYGQDFLDVSTGAWGGLPYTDLMALTDATTARPDVDASRTAAMGGSFGGYMANWVAGHTDRFRAIVTHASIWHLDGFVGTTDGSYHWVRQWGDPIVDRDRYDEHSPHRWASEITTPMLVIHGDKDYRVPIGEGLRLWYDLQRHGRVGDVSQFLYFPDENHWVLRPGDAKLWYSTVFAFLAHHVLGQDWVRPELV
ncbi:prolyl oligopeptidase family serine peptidase [Actinomycetospora endophytica]|uniref:Prolyl oligopeptidase family serine peptidase n=1 Tax=Actinomycetospora endophytica TaxID=2291215 RepID=A0ABS8PFU0_9PSEU|nr:prolyl oligopeptidase family serine peptidase [Actinomycetospora endophytica]MCD2197147.1 prolyl oligopeptidase family serine peptidase [Actinomycetospora endophytica]